MLITPESSCSSLNQLNLTVVSPVISAELDTDEIFVFQKRRRYAFLPWLAGTLEFPQSIPPSVQSKTSKLFRKECSFTYTSTVSPEEAAQHGKATELLSNRVKVTSFGFSMHIRGKVMYALFTECDCKDASINGLVMYIPVQDRLLLEYACRWMVLSKVRDSTRTH